MSATQNDKKRYLPRNVELKFSYKIPATPANAPSVIRDGNGAQVASVSAISSGLQTITFQAVADRPGLLLPYQLTYATVQLHRAATGTIDVKANIVAGSYSQSARTIQVVYTKSSDGSVLATGTGLAAADWVVVELCGPETDLSADAA